MKKNIIFTIMAIAAFGWYVTDNTTKPEKDLPVNSIFIIKSNLLGTCRVSIIGTAADTKKMHPSQCARYNCSVLVQS